MATRMTKTMTIDGNTTSTLSIQIQKGNQIIIVSIRIATFPNLTLELQKNRIATSSFIETSNSSLTSKPDII